MSDIFGLSKVFGEQMKPLAQSAKAAEWGALAQVAAAFSVHGNVAQRGTASLLFALLDREVRKEVLCLADEVPVAP